MNQVTPQQISGDLRYEIMITLRTTSDVIVLERMNGNSVRLNVTMLCLIQRVETFGVAPCYTSSINQLLSIVWIEWQNLERRIVIVGQFDSLTFSI